MLLSKWKASHHEPESQLNIARTPSKRWKNFFQNGNDLKTAGIDRRPSVCLIKTIFLDYVEQLFEIVHANAMDLIENGENKLVLENQRKRRCPSVLPDQVILQKGGESRGQRVTVGK